MALGFFPKQSLFPLDARTHASCKSEPHLQITPSICSQLKVCELSYLDHDFVASVMDVMYSLTAGLTE